MESGAFAFGHEGWLGISTRLIWLAALLLAAGLQGRLSLVVFLILLAWSASFLAYLAVKSQHVLQGWLAWLLVLLDLAFSVMLVAASGLFSSPLWSGLLIGGMTAGLSFGSIATVTVTALNLIVTAVVAQSITQGGLGNLAPLGIYIGILMLIALAIGQLTDRLQGRGRTLRSLTLRKSLGDSDRNHLQAIFRMVAELNATLNYERVLDMALEVSASALSGFRPEDDKLVGGLLLFDGDDLRVVSGRRLTHADWRVVLPGEKGLIGEAFASGDPVLGSNPKMDPEIKRLVAFHACRQLLCLPLLVGLEAYGVFLFGHPVRNYFRQEQIELLEAISQQSMVALQNARLYRDLEQEKERIMQIEEEARKRLARDLHDGPTQSIAALAMRLNFARRLMERDQKAASQELYKVEDLARRTTKEIRHMLFTLRPLILESQGLVMALRQLAEKVHETHGQNVIVEAEQNVANDLELGKQGVIFYIAEEAVNNAGKHAEAEHIWVRLKMRDELFVLEIEDDGVGFNIGAVDQNYAQRGSLGMVNMRERAELINGVLHIDSAEGKGTRIMLTVPTTPASADRLHRRGGA